MKKRVFIAGLACLLSLAPLAAPAGTLTGNMAVTATILAGCTAMAAPAIAFGALINPGSTNVHPAVAPQVSVTCATGIPAVITLNGGLNAVANVRQLKNGANLIPYGIDQVTFVAPVTPWGDNGTTITGTGVSVTGTGVALLTNLFPLIPSVPLAQAAGAYTDTVVATVTF
jgi:spore coat protein U-like protein